MLPSPYVPGTRCWLSSFGLRVRTLFGGRSLGLSPSILLCTSSPATAVSTLPASIAGSAETSPAVVALARATMPTVGWHARSDPVISCALLLTPCDRRRAFGVTFFAFFAARVVFVVVTRWRSSLRRSRWRIARQLFVKVPGDPMSARWLKAGFSTWTTRRAVQSCV